MDVTFMIYILLTVFLARWIYLRIYNYLHYNYPPGSAAWPVVGSTFHIDLKQLHQSLWDHKDRYGDVSYLYIGGDNIVVLNTIETIKEFMNGDKYKIVVSGRPKSFFSDHFLPHDMGQQSYSEKWVKMRNLMQTTIKPYAQDLREIEIIVISELKVLKNIFESMQVSSFDVKEFLTRSVGNIIFIVVTGKRFEYDHQIHSVQHAVNIESNKLLSPWLNGILTTFPFLRHFPIGPGKIFQDSRNYLEAVMQHLYYDIKNTRYGDKKGFLYDLLRKQHESDWLTDSNVHNMIADLILAGNITSSTTLYAAFLILLHHPDVQKKLQDETDDVVGGNREPCLDDQANMHYTQAFIMELLRYTSIVPISIPHSTLEDIQFRTYHFQKNTIVLPNMWRVNHDESLWQDPWKFKPERFLDDEGQFLPSDHPNRTNMVVFGLGKRRCIGDRFALTRLFLFVTHICQRFHIYNDCMEEVPSMDPRDYIPYFVLSPKPYKIQLRVRE